MKMFIQFTHIMGFKKNFADIDIHDLNHCCGLMFAI